MVVNNVTLAAVGVKNSQFPDDEKPEIAFVGKSNVGKSSLINSMIYRKALARTSQNPGKTRTINFYNVEDSVYFVDLPGYGYAKASKGDIEAWGRMIENYIIKRTQLQAIIMLIDIRHEPSLNDIQMYEWLKYYDYITIIAATKSDKLSRNEIVKNLNIIKKTLKLHQEDLLIPFSSETKSGRDELWDAIEKICINSGC